MARAVPGARLVKAFNTMFAGDLATRGRPDLPFDELPVLFMAGDDEDAKRVVAALIQCIGFAPLDTGSLREGGRRQEPGSPIYTKLMTPREAKAALRRLAGAGEAAPDQPGAHG